MTASLKVCPIYQPHPACFWLRHSKYALYINHIQPVHDCVTQSMPYISTTFSLFMTGPSKYALYINHVQPVYDWSLKVCLIYINHIQPVYDCVTQSMPYISTTSSLFMTASLKVCPIYQPHPACSWLVTQSMPYISTTSSLSMTGPSKYALYISTTSSLFMTASLKVCPIYQPHPACLWLVTQSMPTTTSSLFMTGHSKYALYILVLYSVLCWSVF